MVLVFSKLGPSPMTMSCLSGISLKASTISLTFLIGYHARGGQVVILLVLAAGEGIDIDRRVNDVGFAAVDFLDAARDEAAIGDEVVDAVGCARIPDAHVVQDELGYGTLEAVVEAGRTRAGTGA